jgi:hypothetical protein
VVQEKSIQEGLFDSGNAIGAIRFASVDAEILIQEFHFEHFILDVPFGPLISGYHHKNFHWEVCFDKVDSRKPIQAICFEKFPSQNLIRRLPFKKPDLLELRK